MSSLNCVLDRKPVMEGGKAQLTADKSLLLLGLQLLNKGLKIPTAVVSPHVRPEQQQQQQPASPPLKPSGEAISRKRKREQDDSSEEGKRAKRKMMNRVAAQNARDRKKAYVEDLEKKIALLEEQNRKLLRENEHLKKEAASEREQQPQSYLVPTEMTKEGLVGLTGSAAPCVSLPQKPVPQITLAHFWLLVNLCHLLETSSYVHEQLTHWEDLNLPQLAMLLGNQHVLSPQWWGAWQRKWSPPKKRA